MLNMGLLFDSTAARTGMESEDPGEGGTARSTRQERRYPAGVRSGEPGWWCPEMRSVVRATLGAVSATAALLFGMPALF